MTLKVVEFEPKPTYSNSWSCPLHHIYKEILCKWQSFVWIMDIFIPIKKEYSSIYMKMTVEGGLQSFGFK